MDHVCRKKDKRLLVLLALGIMVMFSNIGISANSSGPAVQDFSWLEIRGDENRLYRLELTDHPVDSTVNGLFTDMGNIPVQINRPMFSRLKQGRAVALRKEQERYTALTTISPRLAFFLGQPFSINTADFDDFTLIPGVGPSLAGNIIAYRENRGPITSAGQLEEIPGIGPRMKQRLQNYFTYSVDRE
jgi:competence ComEA-like helix-hairpin-helix protein